MKFNYNYSFYILFICSFFLCMSSCKKDDGDPVISLDLANPTPEDQREIGLRLKEEIVLNSANFPVLHRGSSLSMQELYSYLNSLMVTLAINPLVVHRNIYDWNVTVIKDDTRIGAFSIPGGHLFIYTGLLKYLKGEHELMAIMAHELKYMDQTELVESLIDEFGSPTLGDVVLGNEVTQMDEMTYWLRDFEYAEKAVEEADAFAVETICQFSYNAKGMKHFLERISQDTLAVDWLNRRPSSSNRIDQIVEKAVNCGHEDKVYEERYQSMISKLP